MIALNDNQVEMIRQNLRNGGIELINLEEDLLDHLCCSIEISMETGISFEQAYTKAFLDLSPNGFKEIQEETTQLLTLKFETMKKSINVLGTIGSSLLFIGAMFRFQHWIGANVILVLGGVLLAFVFMPFMLAYWLKQTDKLLSKLKHISAFTVGILLISGVIFKLMRYPSADIMLFLSMGVFLIIFLPLLLKTSEKEDIKIQPISVAVLLLVGASLFFAFNSQRKTDNCATKSVEYTDEK